MSQIATKSPFAQVMAKRDGYSLKSVFKNAFVVAQSNARRNWSMSDVVNGRFKFKSS